MTTLPEGEVLYAGKFKTVAELEEGYKNSAKVFQENEDIKKKFEEVTKIPDHYNTPTDIQLHENDVADVQKSAKASGLTQAQYEKLVRETTAKSAAKHEAYESAKRDMGADNLNVLQDFINKTYPEKLRDIMLKQAITNNEVRETILNQRQEALRTGVPGMNRVAAGGNYQVTEKDAMKARDEMNATRGKARIKAQERYIALQREIAHQKANA